MPQLVLARVQRPDVVESLDPRLSPVDDDQLEPWPIVLQACFAAAHVPRALVEVDHGVRPRSGKTRSSGARRKCLKTRDGQVRTVQQPYTRPEQFARCVELLDPDGPDGSAFVTPVQREPEVLVCRFRFPAVLRIG